jgi:hypothetical protein
MTEAEFVLLENLITMHVGGLFPGFRVVGCSPFRVTRNFQVREAVRTVPGIGDYRVERLLGQPSLSAVVDRKRTATYGVRVEDA